MHAMNLDIGLAARVIAGIRTHTAQRTGCREWDTPGIVKALKETEGAPGDVLAAAAIAAQDVKLDKPSARGFQMCWHSKATQQPRPSNNIPCPEHPGHVMPCRRCTEGTRPPTPEELADMRAAAKKAAEYHAEMQRLQEQRKAAKG